MPLSNGATFAGFRIVRLLGSGGMGEVYLAQHPRLPKQIALKILPAATSSDTEFRERFAREADLAATLYHPHIVGVHDRGESDGQLWIAMDFVDGADAGRLLAERYPTGMPLDQVVAIVSAVASALDYAHRRGMLHRDVKPANIMLTDDDEGEQRILLADFGIARNLHEISGLTATNMTVGTVAYAAPEQLMGKVVDGRADEYALAATAYHLLTGSQLFPQSNAAVMISHHLTEPPPTPSTVDPAFAPLDKAFVRALTKNPEDRYPRCQDFATALATPGPASSVASPTALTQEAPAAKEQPTQARRKRFSPVQLAVAAAVALGLIGSGVAILQPWNNQRNQMVGGSTTLGDAANGSTAPTRTSSLAAPPPLAAATSGPPPTLPTTTTTTTTSTTTTTLDESANGQEGDWREHNTWVCDTATGEVCGNWTPEAVAFACKAIVSGADYTAGLKNILMSRYGMGDTDAFFLGKEAMYSVSSGGYINTGSMADGPHPLCNGIVP